VAEFFVLQLGAALGGLTLVPIPLGVRHAELVHLLGQSNSAGLFLVPEHRGVPMAATAEEVRSQLLALREVVSFSDWPAFLASGTDETALPSVDPRSTAQVLYTSGSTGLPKGALVHHHGITNSARLLAQRMGVTAEDVWLNFMPLSYIAGNSIAALGALAAGATQVLCDFDPGAVAALIEAERCSVTASPFRRAGGAVPARLPGDERLPRSSRSHRRRHRRGRLATHRRPRGHGRA
jgi:acyl-CoA synthetase (AMP-forming)/AMP-acid ligase II